MVYQLKLYGLGGQGVVTAAAILVEAVTIYENRYGRSLPAFGHERRGAPVFADVMIDEQPILLSSFVYDPDCVMLFDPSLVGMGINVGQGVRDHTVLVANAETMRSLPDEVTKLPWKETYCVNATTIALQAMGRPILNSPMLGALAKTGTVDLESVCQALVGVFGAIRGEGNVRAAREAYSQVRTD
ncbi:MAG TPA: 2-oxoacid:acceptor oxidoreductase family protein [Anaerolineae bacterium]|nr:2-oxoacid:acceptor oxidoreductase family protein [Anaerolineae bacterium]